MKFIFGFVSLLMIIPIFATKKILRIINDTGQDYVVQLERSHKDNPPVYLCRSTGWCLVDFSYECYKNTMETHWYEHATKLKNNRAYQLTMQPRNLLSILIFSKAHKVAGKSYSFESVPYSILLSDLLAKKEGSDPKRESSEAPRIELLHTVKKHEYSPRIDQEKLNKVPQKRLLKANL